MIELLSDVLTQTNPGENVPLYDRTNRVLLEWARRHRGWGKCGDKACTGWTYAERLEHCEEQNGACGV